jgi:hypothetical protein
MAFLINNVNPLEILSRVIYLFVVYLIKLSATEELLEGNVADPV